MRNVEIRSDFTEFQKVFLEENSVHNLISKNEEKFLWEKHIYDSLSVKLFFDKYKITQTEILDIGCGGGFPCVPVAIEYPELDVTGVDSIRKKIGSVTAIKEKLRLKNLHLICDRVENIKDRKFGVVLSRAVGDLGKVAEYALPLLEKGGYFVAYKSKKADEEIERATAVIRRYGGEVIDVISYELPTEEVYERKLICIKKI